MRRAVEHQRPMVTKSGWTSHSPSGLCLQIAGVPVDLLKLLLVTTKAEQMLLSPSHSAASPSPRLWERFSLGPVPLSPHL